MRLIIINSFGPMASSVVASLIEKLGYINLPIRKRKLNECVLERKKISDDFFKERTLEIFKKLSNFYKVGGISVLDRNKKPKTKRLDINKIQNEIKIFKEMNDSSIQDLYFSSMILGNSATIYKDAIKNPLGAIELTTNIQKYDIDLLYKCYKKHFDDVKVININRNFDGWLNSLCSQLFSKKIKFQYLKFNIFNYKKAFLKYSKNIHKFNGLNINFKDIFIPNTENLSKEISEYLENDNDFLLNIRNQEFDCYGSLSDFNKTFELHDDKINFLSVFSKKFARYYFLSKNFFPKDLLCVIFFQILYIFDHINYKLKFKSNEEN